MKRYLLIVVLFAATALAQSNPAERVANDAIVLDRVAEASKRDLPTDLLKRIINEDIELLRGRRPDGSYEYAAYERFEAGRINSSHSIQPRTDKMQTIEVRGAYVYRVIVDAPSRRMIVRRNKPVWVERIDVDYVADGSTVSQHWSFEIKAWLQPGEIRPIDLPAIARQATMKVIATTDEKQGYGNLDIALVQARIVDEPDSPFAAAVTAAKAVQRALDNGDVNSIRVTSQRMREALGAGTDSGSTIAVVAPRPSTTVRVPVQDAASRLEMQTELQMIEDLLTGTEAERREGLDRLHQLIRRMRQ